MNQDRLRDMLREKGRLIVSTVVPDGYSITDDGRDADIHQVMEFTAWDKRMNR